MYKKNKNNYQISYGIIPIKINHDNNINVIKNIDLLISRKEKIPTINSINDYGSIDNISHFLRYVDSIKFLLIKRKHTYGYSDFMRGKYNPNNISSIISLFKQMSQNEIDNIKNKNFLELINEFWDNRFFYNESIKSQRKFESLKHKKFSDGDTYYEHITNNTKPSYQQEEWGFPKGQKNKNEMEIECALREFQEETGINSNSINVLNLEPIIEDYMGTNGIRYKHIYFLGIFNDNIDYLCDISTSKNLEVSEIKFLPYNNAIDIIRPYLHKRKKIIMDVYLYILKKILDD